MSRESLRTERQRHLRERFRQHELGLRILLEAQTAKRDHLEDKVELMQLLLNQITATLENAGLREAMVELRQRISDRGRVTVASLGYTNKPKLWVVS